MWIGVVVGFVVGLFGSALAVGLVSAFGWGDGSADDLPTAVAGIAGLWVGFIGVPVLWARLRRESVTNDFGLRASLSDGRFLLLGAVMQVPILSALYWLLFELVGQRELDPEAAKLVDTSTGPWLWALGVVFVLGAPVAEELFFRGLLQRAAVGTWGAHAKPIVAVWLPIATSATVFALSHFQPWKIPGLVLLALLLGWLAYRHRRLGPSIAVHMGFNAVAFSLLVLDRVNK